MKIVFWSCRPGLGNVSSSMLAVAAMSTLEYTKKCCVLQTQYSCNNLQYPFFKLSDKENVEQYNDVGMDALLRTVKGGGVSREAADSVVNCGISFMNSRLTVYTQSTSTDKRAYLHSLAQTLSIMFTDLKQAFDVTFIDTAAGNDAVSMQALKEADLIVVCLPQVFWLDNFFFTKYRFTGKNVFYLFTDYELENACSLKNLRKRYHQLKKENSAYILHNVDYSSALNLSNFVSFFMKNYSCKQQNPNYEFMQSVKASTEKILNFAGVRAH